MDYLFRLESTHSFTVIKWEGCSTNQTNTTFFDLVKVGLVPVSIQSIAVGDVNISGWSVSV
jgi:hypothetical protein